MQNFHLHRCFELVILIVDFVSDFVTTFHFRELSEVPYMVANERLTHMQQHATHNFWKVLELTINLKLENYITYAIFFTCNVFSPNYYIYLLLIYFLPYSVSTWTLTFYHTILIKALSGKLLCYRKCRRNRNTCIVITLWI